MPRSRQNSNLQQCCKQHSHKNYEVPHNGQDQHTCGDVLLRLMPPPSADDLDACSLSDTESLTPSDREELELEEQEDQRKTVSL